ncbi:MAG: molybdopterin-dependent oxidoreductase [Proteobacteria bacterium]|nr:molybdopterin-dependent oxidoreductase [Pseudomonadota bacterium]
MESNGNSLEKHYRACHLCEATCGIEITHNGNEIISIKGDKNDPFSQGHFCPKALVLKDVYYDPDRLRKPVKRSGDKWHEISWEEALDTVADRFAAIRSHHGPDSIGSYLGNPSVHNYGMMTHVGHFLGLIKSKNRFSATSLDQLPHHLVSYKMYGHQMLIPIPDVEQTDFFLMIGGNPVASNGSLMTLPNAKNRLKAIGKRGGKLIVIDPRRTETAKIATEHHFIKPGTDAWFLLALLNSILEKINPLSPAISEYCKDLDKIRNAVSAFTPEKAEPITEVSAADIHRIASEFINAEKAVCYGRMGVSVQRFGALCQWLIQLINIVTSNLDKPGGVLFTHPAFDTIGGFGSKPGHYARWHSRVNQLPEFGGELPTAALIEEIRTEGEGQIKALFTAAANPVLTAQNGTALEKALSSLDFMVSLDFYINETTRFADIILPPTFTLEHDHYDIAFNALAIRNVAKYSAPLFNKAEGAYHDWEIYTELGKRLANKLDVQPRQDASPDQMLDFMLQSGPYSAQAGHELSLSLEVLKKHPHGLDLGPLKPSLPDRLATEDKKINCAPDVFLKDIPRVNEELSRVSSPDESFLLIGRRHLFDANSWLHNCPRLLKGKDRCRLLLHPADAEHLNIRDRETVNVISATGALETTVLITDDIMRGVVCLPHGWGHHRPGTNQKVASQHAGVSMNDLTDHNQVDPVSGNAVLNAVSVKIEKIGP